MYREKPDFLISDDQSKTPEERLLETEGFQEHINRIHEGLENGTIKTVSPDDLP